MSERDEWRERVRGRLRKEPQQRQQQPDPEVADLLAASAEGKDVLFIDDDPLVEMEAGSVAWGVN